MALMEDMIKGFVRRDTEIARLREDFNRMLEVIRSLQEGLLPILEEPNSLRDVSWFQKTRRTISSMF
ncbi:MAG: hypothetical protein QXQ11_08745 [Candidatus Bathyarchaeia archaeon]